jgi:cytochrome P450
MMSRRVEDRTRPAVDRAVAPALRTAPPEATSLLQPLLAAREAPADPYPIYHRLHEHGEMARNVLGLDVVWSHDACSDLLRHPAFGRRPSAKAARAGLGPAEVSERPALRLREGALVFQNPPAHTRLRGLVSKVFTSTSVERMTDSVETVVADLVHDLHDLDDLEPVDLVDRLAYPLPLRVVGHLLGLPEADLPRFRELVRRAVRVLDPVFDAQALLDADNAVRELHGYFVDLLRDLERRPGDNLLSHLVGVRKMEGTEGGLTYEDIAVLAIFTFSAGFETTAGMLAMGILALLRDPNALAQLRADATLVPAAVDEFLRFDSPIQFTARSALAECSYRGVDYIPGDGIVLMTGAANRDPTRFPDPDRLRFDRGGDGSRIIFGAGVHYCLGAALARLEGAVAFRALLRDFPVWELAGEPSWHGSVSIRGMNALPVVLRRPGR